VKTKEIVHLNNGSMVKNLFINMEVKGSNLHTYTLVWWAKCFVGLGS
jgi:hypothetical protein